MRTGVVAVVVVALIAAVCYFAMRHPPRQVSESEAAIEPPSASDTVPVATTVHPARPGAEARSADALTGGGNAPEPPADRKPVSSVSIVRFEMPPIERYENSPARGTPECQGILNVLTNHGYGIEYLEDAYNIATFFHSPTERRNLVIGGEAYDPANAAHIAAEARSNVVWTNLARAQLRQLLRTADESTLDEVLKFQPSVPYRTAPVLTPPPQTSQ